MNKQEIVEKIKEMTVETFFSGTLFVNQKEVIKLIEQLDEPQAGHSEEAPRYVKNILARLRELPLHDREVWLKAIMSEFEQDFSRAKWREGYEQGKLEGSLEADKKRAVVHQFVADWYEKHKDDFETSLFQCIYEIFKKRNDNELTEIEDWLISEHTEPFQTLVNMHQFGYEVEREKRYEVILCNGQSLKTVYRQGSDYFDFEMVYGTPENFTKKQLEDAGFGWVFSCEGIEIEEVE